MPKPVLDLKPTFWYICAEEYFLERRRQRGQRIRYWDELTFDEMKAEIDPSVLGKILRDVGYFAAGDLAEVYKERRISAKRIIREKIQYIAPVPTAREKLAAIHRARADRLYWERQQQRAEERREERARLKEIMPLGQQPDWLRQWAAETKLRRSRVNWFDLLPPEIAYEQIRWERAATMLAMFNIGMSFTEVGRHYGVTVTTVTRHIDWQARVKVRARGKTPVEQYMAEKSGGISLKAAVEMVREKHVGPPRRSRIKGPPVAAASLLTAMG